MNYAALLGSSIFALVRNKMRSVLTVLGITIGIAAVICVVAIGKAGQVRVEEQLNNLGDAFVFQGFNLIARTTALENVQLPTLYAPIDRALARERAAAALALVGLAERSHHFPSQMSGGQQQRVAIARALVNQPSILFADEPTGNLDSRTSIEIMDIFQTLNDQGLTIVLVTHEHDIAQFAKRVLVFRDGKIRTDELVQTRPAAREVLRAMPTLED